MQLSNKFSNSRVPKNKQDEWMAIIKSTYPSGESFPTVTTYVVCDLHFKPEEIVQRGGKHVLVINALPQINTPNASNLGTNAIAITARGTYIFNNIQNCVYIIREIIFFLSLL